MSVTGRVAVVTGAGGGLGREYALALAHAGAKVVINDYGGSMAGEAGSISRAQTVVNEITEFGGTAVADGHDVSVPADAKEIIETAVKSFGKIDILVNNAGIPGKVTSSHDDVDAEAFMRVLQIAVLGTTLVTAAAYPVMRAQNYGRIINISSNAIYGFGAGGDCVYSASKGAVFAITRDLGRFSEKDGIKINGLLPSGWSRMGDMTEGTKTLTRTYFDPAKVAPFVVALSSDECPVSGELFSSGAGHAARETLATFPGSTQSTAEAWIKDWAKVMGEGEPPYLPTSCLDHVGHLIKNATGEDLMHIADFGLAGK